MSMPSSSLVRLICSLNSLNSSRPFRWPPVPAGAADLLVRTPRWNRGRLTCMK